MSGNSGTSTDYKNKLNNHTLMICFAVFFIIFAFICLLALWGAQTGSCETSGLGSALRSSQDDTGEISATSEVIAEFMIVLFTVIGVGMLTWALCIKHNSSKLVAEKEYKAALLINSSKNVTADDIAAATKDQMEKDAADAKIPLGMWNKFKAGMANTGRDLYDETGRFYSSGARKTGNAYRQTKATFDGSGYKNADVRRFGDDRRSPQNDSQSDNQSNDDDYDDKRR